MTGLPSPRARALDQARDCLASGQVARAVQVLQVAAALAPGDVGLRVGLGVAQRMAGQWEAAAASFEQALASAPDQADAQVYLGMIRLAQGRQQEGWPLYHARWRAPGWTDTLRYPAQDLWQGPVRPGMRLLLWAEQGFGDTLQFARYAPWLARQLRAQGASLALELPAPLCALLQASWPFIDIFATGQGRGRFDAHLPLLDLPLRWGGRVGPGGLPYQPMPSPYLSALPDLWSARRGVVRRPLAGLPAPLRVGVAWAGRASNPDDRWRSIPAVALQPLFDLPGIRWVSLQKGASDHPAWLPADDGADFADTARRVADLDLVISIDSALGHLAGAMGRPVWLLLSRLPDWRWGLSGETSPWYPATRLFRQAQDEAWPAVIDRLATALAARVAMPARPALHG